MKNKLRYAILTFILVMSMPLSVCATEDTILEGETVIEIETNDNGGTGSDSITLQSGVNSDPEISVEVENQTETNAPSNGSQSASAALTNIRELRRTASNLLSNWRDSIRNSRRLSGSQLVQAIQNGNSLIVIGNHTFDMDEFKDCVVGPASTLWTMLNNPGSRYSITQNEREAAQRGSGGASQTGARYPGWNRLSPELQNEAMSTVMIKEGLTPSEEVYIEVYYPENQNIGRIGLRNGKIWDDLEGLNSGFRRLGTGGFRFDLVMDGLRDTPYWYNRFNAYTYGPNSSSASEDYINVTYLQEYRITNVTATDVTEVDYDNCERVWTVENTETGAIEEYVRNTEDLTFTISGLSAGEYKVTPAIKTTITTGSTVSYRVYEYMYETSTHNLLYYNETGTETIYLGGTTRGQGYVPTGEVFLIHVNALGEIEQESNYIQMID